MKTLFTTIAAAAVLVSASAHADPNATCFERMRTDAASNRTMVDAVSDAIVLKILKRTGDVYEASDADRKDKVMWLAFETADAVAAVTEKPTTEFVRLVAVMQAGATLRQLDRVATIRRNAKDPIVGMQVQIDALKALTDGIILAALTSCESRP